MSVGGADSDLIDFFSEDNLYAGIEQMFADNGIEPSHQPAMASTSLYPIDDQLDMVPVDEQVVSGILGQEPSILQSSQSSSVKEDVASDSSRSRRPRIKLNDSRFKSSLSDQIKELQKYYAITNEGFEKNPITVPNDLSVKQQRQLTRKEKNRRDAQLNRIKHSITKLEEKQKIEQLVAENQSLKQMTSLPSLDLQQLHTLQAENQRLKKANVKLNEERELERLKSQAECESLKQQQASMQSRLGSEIVGLSEQLQAVVQECSRLKEAYQKNATSVVKVASGTQTDIGSTVAGDTDLLAKNTKLLEENAIYEGLLEKREIELNDCHARIEKLQQANEELMHELQERGTQRGRERQNTHSDLQLSRKPPIEHARHIHENRPWQPLPKVGSYQNANLTQGAAVSKPRSAFLKK